MGHVILKQVASIGGVVDLCLVSLHDKKWSSSHGVGWKLQGESSVCLEKGPLVFNMGGWD